MVLVAVQRIRAGIVSPASVEVTVEHCRFRPRRSFHCRSRLPCDRIGQWARWWCWWLSTIRAGIVSPAGVQSAVDAIIIHPRRSFHCQSRLPCDRLGQWARWWCWWLSNYPCWDCISRRYSNSCRNHLRPRRSFHCRSRLPCDRLGPEGALVVLVAPHWSVHGDHRVGNFRKSVDNLP